MEYGKSIYSIVDEHGIIVATTGNIVAALEQLCDKFGIDNPKLLVPGYFQVCATFRKNAFAIIKFSNEHLVNAEEEEKSEDSKVKIYTLQHSLLNKSFSRENREFKRLVSA